MEVNHLELSGRVLKIEKPRRSPAGVPHQHFVIEHRSKQIEANFTREARCQVIVQVSGEALQNKIDGLLEGEHLVVSGFIGRSSYQQEPYRILLHAQTVERKAV